MVQAGYSIDGAAADSLVAARFEAPSVLQACCGFAVAAPALGQTESSEDSLAAPQENDALAFAYGDRAGQVIAPADVVLGAKQLLAFPWIPRRNACATARG